ncbi:long-chain fatty aldehyde decarbonylase [Leptolyngbyaceae cyanobacterium CCMR0082]|uniref:Long-chain fatty aldehyde decarbonylase n=1 Tax=Adonisia turfae CCMR0082 TaxID=2304604 RepID=A0A6M0SAC2_9CYAN|nr:long-chain fatty aldehyde decarbonylase [Adonisia turfae]NEZ64931.1 long-chain fatty aldehyde decarbonylase [Adonisia turfae CCMR0082]
MVAEVQTKSVKSSTLKEYNKQYQDLLAFLISTLIAGEITATENYCRLVALLEDTDEKMEAVHQAYAESKHVRNLVKLAKRLNLPVVEKIVEPEWFTIRKHFDAALAKKNLAVCYIIQDVMIEILAITTYLGLAGIGKTTTVDGETARVSESILNDELEHFEIGISRLKQLLQQDSDEAHDALIWAHHRVMPEILTVVREGCTSLCGELGVVCGTFNAGDMGFESGLAAKEIVRRYIEALERIGFDQKIVNSLVSGLSDYQPTQESVPVKVKTSGCC